MKFGKFIFTKQQYGQDRESGTCQERESGTRPGISPRLRAATRLRIAALGGFRPSQARPQQAPLVGAALVALAGGGHQQALCGAALMTSVAQGCWSGWQDSGQVSG